MDETLKKPFWGYLLHLGYSMWSDRPMPEINLPHYAAHPCLRCYENAAGASD